MLGEHGSATQSLYAESIAKQSLMIGFETKYAVKLFFPSATFTQIYFETIANAFDAGATEISIHIFTNPSIDGQLLEITVADNGEGFTDERLERFSKVKEPVDKYHKGLGRLVFLSYFSQVSIASVFENKKRTFVFSENSKGQSKTISRLDSDKQGTTLKFSGFQRQRLWSYDDVTPSKLKEKLIHHFLPSLERRKREEKPFKITINLQIFNVGHQENALLPDSQTITEEDIPKFESKIIHDNRIHAFADIAMRFMIQQGTSDRLQLTAVSVDERTIPIPLLDPGAIPIDCSAIFLFESDLFIGKSDSARQRLILPEEIIQEDLFRVLRRAMAEVLNEKLEVIAQRNTTTKQLFEERYPHLTGYFEEETVGIIDRDAAIEIAQRRFFREQKAILESNALDDAMFEKSLEISSRTLAEYVLYRELIIKRLREITKDDKEEKIHNLIIPMSPKGETFQSEGLVDAIYRNNAWLLDDKFMSFRTILSNMKMQKIISAITLNEDADSDTERPDITMIFSADPAVKEKVDVVVVELKRRTVDDKEGPYAVTQLIKRAQKLVDYCPSIQRVWYFAIIEINSELSRLLQSESWTPLFSKGLAFYREFPVKRTDGPPVPTPVCLLSYDAIVEDAAARNHTFLEILKSDIRRISDASGDRKG